MSEILRELEELGEHIKVAKSEKAKEEGRLEEMKRSMKSEFEVESSSKAEEMLTVMEKELKDLDEEIEKDYTELRTNYPWK